MPGYILYSYGTLVPNCLTPDYEIYIHTVQYRQYRMLPPPPPFWSKMGDLNRKILMGRRNSDYNTRTRKEADPTTVYRTVPLQYSYFPLQYSYSSYYSNPYSSSIDFLYGTSLTYVQEKLSTAVRCINTGRVRLSTRTVRVRLLSQHSYERTIVPFWYEYNSSTVRRDALQLSYLYRTVLYAAASDEFRK